MLTRILRHFIRNFVNDDWIYSSPYLAQERPALTIGLAPGPLPAEPRRPWQATPAGADTPKPSRPLTQPPNLSRIAADLCFSLCAPERFSFSAHTPLFAPAPLPPCPPSLTP